MKEEYQGVLENKTWVLVDLPDNKTIVSCKWVFKLKSLADGSIKYKARLGARGFTQIHGVDILKLFHQSPLFTLFCNSSKI